MVMVLFLKSNDINSFLDIFKAFENSNKQSVILKESQCKKNVKKIFTF